MTTHHVLDTHAVVWFLDGDQRLSERVRTILRDESVPLVLPTIVLAEVKYLSQRRRFPVTIADVLNSIGSLDRCTIYPADLQVVEAMPAGLDIHDGLIVGTALVLQPVLGDVAVVTCDNAIVDSDHIPTVW